VTWLDGFQRVTYDHTPGLGTTPAPNRGIVFHTTEGSTFEGADSVYRRTQAAPHFTVDPWRELRVQHIDTDLGAYALRNLAGGVETNTLDVVQVEIVGYTAEGVAAAHGRAQFGISRLSEWNYRWLGEQVLRPILEAHPTIPRTIYSGDRMTGDEWAAWLGGICAHAHVPENDHWDGSTLDFEQMLGHASPTLTPQGVTDMTPEQFVHLLGPDATLGLDGRCYIRLRDGKDYPLSTVLHYVHLEAQDAAVAARSGVQSADVSVVELVDELGRRLHNG
jgi:hypothetical protein